VKSLRLRGRARVRAGLHGVDRGAKTGIGNWAVRPPKRLAGNHNRLLDLFLVGDVRRCWRSSPEDPWAAPVRVAGAESAGVEFSGAVGARGKIVVWAMAAVVSRRPINRDFMAQC